MYTQLTKWRNGENSIVLKFSGGRIRCIVITVNRRITASEITDVKTQQYDETTLCEDRCR